MNAFAKPAIYSLESKQVGALIVVESADLEKLIVVELKSGPLGGAAAITASHTDQD